VDAALAKTPSASNDPFMKIISEKVVKFGKQEPAYPWDINLAMGAAIESAMKNVADVPTALKTANDAINEIIKKQALAGTNPRK
jgi:multiple sugar transport system substrate-binding protein